MKAFVLAVTADRFNIPVELLCCDDAEDSSPKISHLPQCGLGVTLCSTDKGAAGLFSLARYCWSEAR
jgi:hypothetical protein